MIRLLSTLSVLFPPRLPAAVDDWRNSPSSDSQHLPRWMQNLNYRLYLEWESYFEPKRATRKS